MKYFITILLLMFSTSIFSQFTSIPDTRFEQALINQGIDSDGVINGQVLTSDISGVVNLNVQGENIDDLTGIADFTSLQNLNCSSNNLSTLDLTANMTLKRLTCITNPLTSLDLSHNTLLENLNIGNTNITMINLTNNTRLVEMFCSSNHALQSIDFSQSVNLLRLTITDNYNLANIDISNCSQLTYLYYDNTFCSATSLDVSGNPNLRRLFFTGFPFNTIDLSTNTALEFLTCPNNGLTSLDVSHNTVLQYLDCGDHNDDFGYFNYITQLDLSHNSQLEILKCNHIGLVNLNIDQCSNLTELWSHDNPIQNLDVSNNTKIVKMYCSNDNVSSIDLSSNTLLEYLDLGNRVYGFNNNNAIKNTLTELNLNSNTNLTTLLLDDNEFLENLYVQNGNNPNMWINTAQCNNLHCIFVDDVNNIPSSWYTEPISNYVETLAQCDALSVAENDAFAVEIYPNPAKDILVIKSIRPIQIIRIYDNSGRLVMEKSNTQKLNISQLKIGLYFVGIQFGVNIKTTQTVIIE